MTMTRFRIGDKGAIIVLNYEQSGVDIDISAADGATMTLVPPSGVSKTVVCALGPLSHQTQYPLDGTEWDEVGTWRIQGEAWGTGPDFNWHSVPVSVQIEAVY